MENENTNFKMGRISGDKVTRKIALDSYYFAFSNTLTVLRYINDTLPQLAETHLDEAKADLVRRIQKLDPEGKKQYDRYKEFSMNRKKRNLVIDHEEAAKLLHERMDLFSLYPLRIPQFIREMSLVYLVTSFEVYLSDILKLAFRARKEMLKTSKKNITYEEAISYPDLDSLLDGIIDKEIMELFSKNIDDIAKILRDRFGSKLNLQEQAEAWQRFREYWYRRNIIVHNNGVPNSIYNLKTKSNHDQNKRLLVEQNYLNIGFNLFESCAYMLHGFFVNIVEAKPNQKQKKQ